MTFYIIKKTDPVVNPGQRIVVTDMIDGWWCCCCLPTLCAYYITCNLEIPQPPVHLYGDCGCIIAHTTIQDHYLGSFGMDNVCMNMFNTNIGYAEDPWPGTTYIHCCGTNTALLSWAGRNYDCDLECDEYGNCEIEVINEVALICCYNENTDISSWRVGVILDVGWEYPYGKVWNYPNSWAFDIEHFRVDYQEPPRGTVITGSTSKTFKFFADTGDIKTCTLNLQFGLVLAGNAGGDVANFVGDLTVD